MIYPQKTKRIDYIKCITLAICIAVTSVFAFEDEQCGLELLVERYQKSLKQPLFASTQAPSGGCPYGKLYDSVYTVKTEHFQVMYVLKGPNATSKIYADTVAQAMEDAWDFHVNKLKMRPPKGSSTSHYYKKKVDSGLYPIEIIDMNYAINCATCTGSTEPEKDENYEDSEILLENDFLTESYTIGPIDTIFLNGDTCIYPKATEALRNPIRNYSYADEWAKGIRVAAYHELYHAIQARYLNLWNNFNLWIEASASGIEEIAMPESDHYQKYLKKYFEKISEAKPITKISSSDISYGNGVLFLYLYNQVSHSLDKEIWESFSQNPDKPFEYQLNKVASKRGLKADSLFHDWSISLAFSGKDRSNMIDTSAWITSDQPDWPYINFDNENNYKPILEKLSLTYYQGKDELGKTPDLTDYTGKASVILFKNKKANIKYIYSNLTLDSLQDKIQASDSAIWVFSRFDEDSEFPKLSKNLTLRAYPTPWRSGNLCFTPLSLDEKFIEIRNRRGDLVLREKYKQATHCMDEKLVRQKMKPGLYRFRVGSKGKLKDLLIVY